jgi:glutamyl-tRNA reductase
MEVLSRAIINKILHGPIIQLKKTSRNSEGEAYVDMVKKLFQLDEE